MTTETLSHEAQQIIKRYRNGYRVAGALDSVGRLAQGAGLLLCIGGIAYAFLGSTPMRFLVAAGAFVVGFILCLLATLVSAIGQGIKASFDTAVHTSPFLTEGQKSIAMSL